MSAQSAKTNKCGEERQSKKAKGRRGKQKLFAPSPRLPLAISLK